MRVLSSANVQDPHFYYQVGDRTPCKYWQHVHVCKITQKYSTILHLGNGF